MRRLRYVFPALLAALLLAATPASAQKKFSDSDDAKESDEPQKFLPDYDKLVRLLGDAFDGSGKAGSKLPILYDEYGVETVIPPAKASLYEGTEPPTTGATDEATQADFYERALELAVCQPTVVGLLVFHSHDEPALAGWQSGVYYVDSSPKSSLQPVRTAVETARDGCTR